MSTPTKGSPPDSLPGQPETIRCWCGAEGTYEQLFDDHNCNGDGECECGGDHLCVCHNHGTCPGCVNCEPDDTDDMNDEGDLR